MSWLTHLIGVPGGTLTVHERPAHTTPGRGEPVPLVLLHGFTGNGQSWTRVAEALPAIRILAPDLPGHGSTRFADEPRACTFASAIDTLTQALDHLQVNRCHLAGYSMGGRLALFHALERRDRVARLILESASPGLATEAERAARRDSDAALARFAVGRGIEEFTARWETTPVLAAEHRLPPHTRDELRAQRLRCRAEGLAASLLGMGAGAQPWLGERLGEVGVPVLLIAGGADEKFRSIGGEMRALLCDARLEIVPGAGHNVHLEQPDAFAALITAFAYPGLAAGATPAAAPQRKNERIDA